MADLTSTSTHWIVSQIRTYSSTETRDGQTIIVTSFVQGADRFGVGEGTNTYLGWQEVTVATPVTAEPVPSTATGQPSPETSEGQSTTPNPASTASPTATSGSTATSAATNAATTSPNNVQSLNTGLSGGAIAGIAIGCAAAGLIIGALLAWLLARRRRKGRTQPEYLPMQYEKEKDLPGVPGVAVGDRLQLDQFLLDSKPDSEIGSELRALGHLIQQHVENNYHLQPFQGDSKLLIPALTNLGLGHDASISTKNLASLTVDPRTRYSAIQHVISKVTFTSTTMDGHSPVSLLPSPVATFNSMIPPMENYRGSREAIEVALTRWRQLSAFLLHSNRSDRTALTPSEDVSTQQAQNLAAALNTFLGPFVAGDREERYEQENHLREVIVECATFGYLLFSQPSDYRFHFGADGKRNGIVVCPGVDKVSDEEGRRFPLPAQPIAAPIVENI